MTFTVGYIPAAQQELAALWIQAPDRAAVTKAANAIDDGLRRNLMG